MSGPLWYNERTGEVLKASRRYHKSGKTAGDLSASLQLNVWRRAEEPGKLTHELVGGGQHARGFTAIENPLWFEHSPPHYVADHKVLKFLRHKIAHFLHDCARESITSVNTVLYMCAQSAMSFSKYTHKVRIQYAQSVMYPKKCAQSVQ